MFIDTHCHLNLLVKSAFEKRLTRQDLTSVDQFIIQAQSVGVERIVTIGTGPIENENCIEIAAHYSSVYAGIGVHPTEDSVSGALPSWRPAFEKIVDLAPRHDELKIVGIGETGIDKYHAAHALAEQKVVFEAHIECAYKNDLALIVHTRNASQETLDVLSAHRARMPRGVIHCFSYDTEFARQVIDMGFFLGIAGNVTHPNKRQLQEVVRSLPLEHIILETDAPWLSPHPHERSQNTPAAVVVIAHFIAQLRGVEVAEIEHATSANACRLFNLKK